MALGNIISPFIWGEGGAQLTPEQIAQQRKVLQALMGKTDTSPVGHWTQGAARIADAIGDVIQDKRLDAAEKENTTYNTDIINSLLGGTSAAPAASAMPATTGAGAELAATNPAPSTVDISGDKSTFIQSLLPAAMDESKRTGVDPRIIVAQAAQETGWGKSAPGNNFFGIKSHGQGGGNSLMTTEYVNGQPVKVQDSFRAYGSPAESVRGYGDFILQNPRYEALRSAQGLDAQLEALQASGYATDPNYSRSVGAIARSIQLPTEVAAATPEAAIEAVAPVSGYVDPIVSAPNAAPILRPFKPGETRPNPDGSYSTEISTTWQLPDGSWANVPSLWMGPNGPQEFSPDDEGAILGAMQKYEAANGPTFQRFPSEQEAVAAAKARSQAGGAGQAAPPLPPPVEVAPAPAVAAVPQQVAQAITPQTPAINPAILRALTDPRATPQTRAVAQALMQQEARKQEALQEQQTWMARQQYEQQQQANDPLRQLQIQKAQIDVNSANQPQRQPLLNLGNGTIYDPNRPDGQNFIQAPNASADVPDSVRALELRAERAGLKPGTQEYNQFMLSGGGGGTSLSVGPNGEISFQQGGAFKPTETQSKDSFFSTRLQSATPTIDKFETALLSLPEAAAGAIPFNLGRYAQTEEYQLAKDAGDDFVAAYLRKDSGAALTKEEKSEYGNLLLPQPGDKASVVEAKRRRRQVAIAAINSGLPLAAVNNVVKALESVPGATEPAKTTDEIQTDIPGVKIRRKN